MKTLIVISLLYTSVAVRGQNRYKEIFLIPKGYTGLVYVLFNQPNSIPNNSIKSKRFYRIPEDGILLTMASPSFDNTNQFFYYTNSAGKWIKIPKQCSDSSNLPTTNVVTFSGSTDLSNYSNTHVYYLKIVISNSEVDQQINSPQYKALFEKKVSDKIGKPFSTFPIL